MKKFYTAVFLPALLLSSYFSSGQGTYISISSNPNGYTFDDPRFWVGGVPPPSNCTGCTIKVNTDVTMVPCCGFSTDESGVFTDELPSATTPSNDGLPITVGMKFRAAFNTSATGARFYKLPGMTGTHIGLLYHSGGALLAQATFTETASGWQTVDFPTPVPLTANAQYVVAVYSPSGDYTADLFFFGPAGYPSKVQGGIIAATPNVLGGDENGVFWLDNTPTPGPDFPIVPYNGSNYWVDVNAKIDAPFLNDMVFTNSSFGVFANPSTTFTQNTYMQLFNTNLLIANDPAAQISYKLNDQLDLNGTSSVQIGNNSSFIDANPVGNPIQGPHQQLGNPGFKVPGIYYVDGSFPGGYTATLQTDGLGSLKPGGQYQPPPLGLNYYTINCDPGVPGSPNTCTDGFVFGPAITSFNATFGDIFLGSVTLPVELVQFIATKQDDGSVLLNWATAQETNSGYFDVERSGNQTDWVKIGTVKAKGNASTTSNYSLVDHLPLDGDGYYRLKMVDLDAKFKYSRTITVNSKNDGRPLVVYNNPFSDMIRIKANLGRAQTLNITVTDMLGRTIISQVYRASSGDNYINLQPQHADAGNYVLHIHGDSYDHTIKLQKQ